MCEIEDKIFKDAIFPSSDYLQDTKWTEHFQEQFNAGYRGISKHWRKKRNIEVYL